jgi:hypothetical protein
MPKMVDIDSVFETGRKNCLLGSACSGQVVMTWYAVWRSSPHRHWCGSNDRGQKRVVYSLVNAWPVRSLVLVITIGHGNSEIPFMKGGGVGRARYAYWRRGTPIQRSRHLPWPRPVPCHVATLSMVEVVGGLGLGERPPPRWL